MCISLCFHEQNSIYWGAPSIHYPARGQAPEIYASLVKLKNILALKQKKPASAGFFESKLNKVYFELCWIFFIHHHIIMFYKTSFLEYQFKLINKPHWIDLSEIQNIYCIRMRFSIHITIKWFELYMLVF